MSRSSKGNVHKIRGCACFAEFSQNFSERQILWSLCLVVFHALTLKLPIQTSLSVAPKLQVCVRSGEKCQIFRKTRTPQQNPNENSNFGNRKRTKLRVKAPSF